MSSGQTVEGAGCVTWWGFGPAQDLLNSDTLRVRPHGELNILLVGSADPRHILKTITGLTDTHTLHVWVIENSMEVVARQLLLLYLSLLTPENTSLHKKTEVFLEVFGNSEIRKETEETLRHAAAHLSLSVTNTLSSDSHSHPCLDTSLLKFKERDEMVRIFKQWEGPPSVPASVRKVWDARVQQHLGTRYDSRHGCFDWDLTMKLHQSGELYQTANQSLLSTRVFNHVRYWGDIVSTPYLSFRTETENKDLLKKQNNQHVKTAQEISEVNILALFECLATRWSSLLNEDDPNPSSSCCQSTDSIITGEKIQNNPPASQTHTEPEQHPEQQTQELDLMNVSGVKVTFLSPDSLSKLPLKNKYRNLFNTIFCSASMVHQVKEIAEESGFTPVHNQSSDIYAVFTREIY
uniref:Dynein axonemal assembly factor 3 n=1 Tax=Sinocyclocheilus grahami TaxID=75366 RepID=A0A672KT83_SINGR